MHLAHSSPTRARRQPCTTRAGRAHGRGRVLLPVKVCTLCSQIRARPDRRPNLEKHPAAGRPCARPARVTRYSGGMFPAMVARRHAVIGNTAPPSPKSGNYASAENRLSCPQTGERKTGPGHIRHPHHGAACRHPDCCRDPACPARKHLQPVAACLVHRHPHRALRRFRRLSDALRDPAQPRTAQPSRRPDQ